MVKIWENETIYDQVLQDDGDDIVFYNFYDNSTMLKFEKEYFYKGGGVINGIFHVNLTTIYATSNTKFWMYWGNSTSSYQGSNDTWAEGYSMVWHFDEASGSIDDSTSTGFDGTIETGATPQYQQTGDIGTSMDFDGTSDGVNIASGICPNDEDVTVELYLKFDDYDADMYLFTPVDDSYFWLIYHDTRDQIEWKSYSEEYNNLIIKSSPTDTSNFNYYVGSYLHSGTKKKTFYNGENVGTSIASCDGYTSSPNSVGYNGETDAKYLDGKIDEVRISTVVRNATWINVTYLSLTNDLLTIGSGEAQAELVAEASLILPNDEYTWREQLGNNTYANESGSVYEWGEFNFTVNGTTSFDYLRINLTDLDENITADAFTMYISLDNSTYNDWGAFTSGGSTKVVNSSNWVGAGDPFPIDTNMSLYMILKCDVPTGIGNETYSKVDWATWDAGYYD